MKLFFTPPLSMCQDGTLVAIIRFLEERIEKYRLEDGVLVIDLQSDHADSVMEDLKQAGALPSPIMYAVTGREFIIRGLPKWLIRSLDGILRHTFQIYPPEAIEEDGVSVYTFSLGRECHATVHQLLGKLWYTLVPAH